MSTLCRNHLKKRKGGGSVFSILTPSGVLENLTFMLVKVKIVDKRVSTVFKTSLQITSGPFTYMNTKFT